MDIAGCVMKFKFMSHKLVRGCDDCLRAGAWAPFPHPHPHTLQERRCKLSFLKKLFDRIGVRYISKTSNVRCSNNTILALLIDL